MKSMAPSKYFFKVHLVGRFVPLVGVISWSVESPLDFEVGRERRRQTPTWLYNICSFSWPDSPITIKTYMEQFWAIFSHSMKLQTLLTHVFYSPINSIIIKHRRMILISHTLVFKWGHREDVDNIMSRYETKKLTAFPVHLIFILSPGTIPILWPLTPKYVTATRPFIKIDMRHRAYRHDQKK